MRESRPYREMRYWYGCGIEAQWLCLKSYIGYKKFISRLQYCGGVELGKAGRRYVTYLPLAMLKYIMNRLDRVLACLDNCAAASTDIFIDIIIYSCAEPNF